MAKYLVTNTGQWTIEQDGRAYPPGATTPPLELTDDEALNLTAYCRLHAELVKDGGEGALVTKAAEPPVAVPQAGPAFDVLEPVEHGDSEPQAAEGEAL